jgi:hypothetical protein
MQEALEHPLPMRCVHHLGVELDSGPVIAQILERRHRRTARCARSR